MSVNSSEVSDGVAHDIDALLEQFSSDSDSADPTDEHSDDGSISLDAGSVNDSQLLASLGIHLDDDDGGYDDDDGSGGGAPSDRAAVVAVGSGSVAERAAISHEDPRAEVLSAELDEHRRQARQEATLSAILHDGSDEDDDTVPHPDEFQRSSGSDAESAPSERARHPVDSRSSRADMVDQLDQLSGVAGSTPQEASRTGIRGLSSDNVTTGAGGDLDEADADLLPPEVLATIRESEAIVRQLRQGAAGADGDGAAERNAAGRAGASDPDLSARQWVRRRPLQQASEAMHRLQASQGAKMNSPFSQWYARLFAPTSSASSLAQLRGANPESCSGEVDGALRVRSPSSSGEHMQSLFASPESVDSRGWLQRSLPSTAATDGALASLDAGGAAGESGTGHTLAACMPSTATKPTPLRDVAAVLARTAFASRGSAPGGRAQRKYGRILCSASSSPVFVLGTAGGYALVFSWRGLAAKQWQQLRPLIDSKAMEELRSRGLPLPEPVDVPGVCFSGEIDLRPRSDGGTGQATVTSIAVSQDGRELAAGLASGEVRLVSLRLQTVRSTAPVFRNGPISRPETAVDVIVDVAGKPRASMLGQHKGQILTLQFTHDGPDSSFDKCGQGLLAPSRPAPSDKSPAPELIAMCDGGVLVQYSLRESFLQAASLHPKVLLDGATARMRHASLVPAYPVTLPALWEPERSALAESRRVPVRAMRRVAQSGWLVAASSLDSTFVFRSRPRFEVQLRWDRPKGVSPLFVPAVAWGFASVLQVSTLASDASNASATVPAGDVMASERDLKGNGGIESHARRKGVSEIGTASASSVLTLARAWGCCVELVQVQPTGGYANGTEATSTTGVMQTRQQASGTGFVIPGSAAADAAAAASSRAFGVGDGSSASENLNFLLCAELHADEPVVALEWLSSSKLLLVSCGFAIVLDTQTMQVSDRLGLGDLQLTSRPLPAPRHMNPQVLQVALQKAGQQQLLRQVGGGADSDQTYVEPTVVSVPRIFEGTPGEASVAMALAHLTFSASVIVGRGSPVRVWGSDTELDGSRNQLLIVGTDSSALLSLQSVHSRCHGLLAAGDSIGAMALALSFVTRSQRESRNRRRLAERMLRVSRSAAAPSTRQPGGTTALPRMRETQLDFGQDRLGQDILVLATRRGLEAVAASKPSTFSTEQGMDLALKCANALAVGRPSPHPCSRLARAAIDFAVAVDRAQPDGPLFREVYEAFDGAAWADLFLVELEPYILHNAVVGMPAAVVVAWIELYRKLGRGDTLERCLLHLSTKSHMDINLLVKVCVRLGLWSALVIVLAEVMRSGTSACDILLVASAPLLLLREPSQLVFRTSGVVGAESAEDRVTDRSLFVQHRARLVLIHFMRQALDARPFRDVDQESGDEGSQDGLHAQTANLQGSERAFKAASPPGIDLNAFRADFLAALCSSADDQSFPDIDEALLATVQRVGTEGDPAAGGMEQFDRSRSAVSHTGADAAPALLSAVGTSKALSGAMVQHAAQERVLSSFRGSIRMLSALPGPFKRLQSCLLLDCRASMRIVLRAVLPAESQSRVAACPNVSAQQHVFGNNQFPEDALSSKPIGVCSRMLDDYRVFEWEHWCVNTAAAADPEVDLAGYEDDKTGDEEGQGWEGGTNMPPPAPSIAGIWPGGETDTLSGEEEGYFPETSATRSTSLLRNRWIKQGIEFEMQPFEVASGSLTQFEHITRSAREQLWRAVSRASVQSSSSNQESAIGKDALQSERGPTSAKGPTSSVVFRSLIDAGFTLCGSSKWGTGATSATGRRQIQSPASFRPNDEDDFICGIAISTLWLLQNAVQTGSSAGEAAISLRESGVNCQVVEHILLYLAATAAVSRHGSAECLQVGSHALRSENLAQIEALGLCQSSASTEAESSIREALLCDLLVARLHGATSPELARVRSTCKAGGLHRASLILAFQSDDVSACVEQYCATPQRWRSRVFGFVRQWLWRTEQSAARLQTALDAVLKQGDRLAPGSDAFARQSVECASLTERLREARRLEAEARDAVLGHLAQLVEVSPRETTRLIVGLYPSERDSVLRVLGEKQRLRFLRELLQANKAAARLALADSGGGDRVREAIDRSVLVRETLMGRKGVADLLQMQDAIELTRDLYPRYLRLLCKLDPGAVRPFLEAELEASGMPSHTALEIVSEQQVPDAIAYLYRGRGRRPDALRVLLTDIEATINAVVESARTRMATGGGGRPAVLHTVGKHGELAGNRVGSLPKDSQEGGKPSHNYSQGDQSDALTVGFTSNDAGRALREADACIAGAASLVQRLKRTSNYSVQLCREGSEMGSEEAGKALWFELLDSMTALSRRASDAGQAAASPSERTAQLAAFRCVAEQLRDVLSGMQECLSLHVVLSKVLAEHGDAPFEQYRQLVTSIVSSARYDESQLRFASDLVKADAKDSAKLLFKILCAGSTDRQASGAALVEARSDILQAMADDRAQTMGSRGARARMMGSARGNAVAGALESTGSGIRAADGRSGRLYRAPSLSQRRATLGVHGMPPGSTYGSGASAAAEAAAELRATVHRRYSRMRHGIELEQVDVESRARAAGLLREGVSLSVHARASQIDSIAICQGSLGLPMSAVDYSRFGVSAPGVVRRDARGGRRGTIRGNDRGRQLLRRASTAGGPAAIDSDDSDAEQNGPFARQPQQQASRGRFGRRVALMATARKDVSEFGRSHAAQRLMRSRTVRDSGADLRQASGGLAAGAADRSALQHAALLDSVYEVALSQAAPVGMASGQGSGRRRRQPIVPCLGAGLGDSDGDRVSPGVPIRFAPSQGTKQAVERTSAITALDFRDARVAIRGLG